jgi:hypothetical protein
MPLVSLFILSAIVLLSGPAHAMTIVEFDKMDVNDRDEYKPDLIVGAERVLREAGHPDQTQRVHKLFTEIARGDDISTGIAEFEIILAKLRVRDLERLQKDANARRLEVEDAMAVTLRNHQQRARNDLSEIGGIFWGITNRGS